MKFDEMLKKAKESGESTGSPKPKPAPPAQPAPGGVPAERTHLTTEEKEFEAEDERNQAILKRRYKKMNAHLEANNGKLEGGGLDLPS